MNLNYSLLYIIQRTFKDLHEHFKIHLITSITVSITLIIFGLYLFLYSNLKKLALRWDENVQIIVYLQKDISNKKIKDLENKLKIMPEIAYLRYCPPDEALNNLKNALGNNADILESLDDNPLPGSFEARIKKDYYSREAIKSIVERVEKEPGVSDVQFGGEWTERFIAAIKIIHTVGITLGILLVLAAITIISNTLKLSFYSRREEIEILRLVGATETFIRFPFRFTAMIEGFTGALFAICILWLIYKYGEKEINKYWIVFLGWDRPSFLSSSTIILLLIMGPTLGLAGSFFSLKRKN